MMSAPCACSILPRRIAVSVVRQTLSRYQESGERLMTPIIEGWELKRKGLPPIENSFTRALAESRYRSTSSANCSSCSIAEADARECRWQVMRLQTNRSCPMQANLRFAENCDCNCSSPRFDIALQMKNLLPRPQHQ